MIHTARLFPVPCLSASIPPGPILLLRDLRLAAMDSPTSIVAFSFCERLESSVCTPIDFLVRRVAGIVDSPGADILLVVVILSRLPEAGVPA